METGVEATGSVDVSVENIGGIERTDVSFSPGVTVLAGRNATNRTSFLRALMAGLGSDDVSLKGDADEGRVELTLDGETHSRTFERRDGAVVVDGDPYLEDATVADLFAFLLENNDARRAVARSADLRDLIMRPVDTETIRTEIDELQAEKRRLDRELERLEGLEGDLPSLERERQRLGDELADKRDALEAKRAEIASADADLEAAHGERAVADETLADLRDVRADIEDVRFDLETERESIRSLRDDRADLEAELADLPDDATDDLARVDGEIDRLQDRKESLDAHINEIRSIVQINADLLDDSSPGLRQALRDGDEAETAGDVTGRLLDGERVVCWTCGSEVERDAVERTVERLRELQRGRLDERKDVSVELERLRDRRAEHRQHRDRRQRIDHRLTEIGGEIEDREERVDTLQERLGELEAESDALQAEIEDQETDRYGELLELHKEASRLELQIDDLEGERNEAEAELESVQREIDRIDGVERRRQELRADLEERRTRIERIEEEAVDAFNDHLNELLDLLDYDNLERIWIDRRETTAREGRRTVETRVFDLHVVRNAESGATYEDTVDHLSESEREVTGLVFALAGYLVHDLHETVPFMLLDSLEAIDADRIATLVEYFADYAPYLVVALLPEDAAALDDGSERVTHL